MYVEIVINILNIPLLLKESFWLIIHLVPFRCHHSKTDCMNRSLAVHFIISVLSLGLIFAEEIKPCKFEIQNLSVASSVKF